VGCSIAFGSSTAFESYHQYQERIAFAGDALVEEQAVDFEWMDLDQWVFGAVVRSEVMWAAPGYPAHELARCLELVPEALE